MRRAVVIDDDPTGGQTVAGVPVTTGWDIDDLRWLLTQDREMGFVLTNSRSMSAERAAEINSLIVARCLELRDDLGIDLSFISRSDSTLRGHFTAELGAICAELEGVGRPADLVLLVPAFFEAGRITRDDLHYVQAEGSEIPVADTAYARDPSFGFAESNLIDWVRARLAAPQASVFALSLTDIRSGRVSGLVEQIRRAAAGAGCVPGNTGDQSVMMPPVLVVNGTEPTDYSIVASAIRECEDQGLSVVTRSGPSYLSARLGEPLPPAVDEVVTARGTGSHGLIVVGSHVPLSTAQLDHLTTHTKIPVIELPVASVVDGDRTDRLDQLTQSVAKALARDHVVLATSRSLHQAADARASLDVAEAVSSAVDEVVSRAIEIEPPAWIVAKGGITSANMVTRVLKLRRGWIVGQIFEGQLPLWRDDDTSGSKPVCVIFPGNVGSESTLTDVVRTLDREGPMDQNGTQQAPPGSDPADAER